MGKRGRPSTEESYNADIAMLRGEKLKALRKKEHLTQIQLAEDKRWRNTVSKGHHKDTISSWENGSVMINIRIIGEISNYFKIPRNYFDDNIDIDKFKSLITNIENDNKDKIVKLCIFNDRKINIAAKDVKYVIGITLPFIISSKSIQIAVSLTNIKGIKNAVFSLHTYIPEAVINEGTLHPSIITNLDMQTSPNRTLRITTDDKTIKGHNIYREYNIFDAELKKYYISYVVPNGSNFDLKVFEIYP